MATRITAPGRIPRDRWLRWALGALVGSALLRLISVSLHAAPVFAEEGAAVGELVSGWLEIIALLPWIVALVLALDAFRTTGERRIDRLRVAALLAVVSFACEAGAALLNRIALEAPLPRGYPLAAEAAILASVALTVAALAATTAFAPGRGRQERERRVTRMFIAVAAGYAFSFLSCLSYAAAYSNYPHHDSFVGGLDSQALGSLGVAVAAASIASAFRRSSRGSAGIDTSQDRERRLARAAWVLAASFLVICMGEAQIAIGITEIGYTGTSEAARWAGTAAGLTVAAAMVAAATGFRRRQPG